ncbi:chaplin [Streptomyces sp. V3I7]|uniref:chaplin n=1 Tax=Streptomyces sp. V3I7 TaxID=3042278 RepID=UPI0027D8D0EE|nr:chaplin [Streptomyces sp. V3I7]
MRRVTRNGVIAFAAASGAMALTMPAHADSSAAGAAKDSPGVASGNTVQLPVHVPVNVCGNTVNVVGLLNPAAGNKCANEGGSGAGAGNGGSSSSGGSGARGTAEDSPGVISGNGVQLPVHLPVNVSGNSVNVVGVLNPVLGNESVNTSGHPATPTPKPPAPPAAPPRAHPEPEPMPPAHPTPQTPRHAEPPATVPLAHTGADVTAPAVAGSAALLLAGAVLFRRFRPRQER